MRLQLCIFLISSHLESWVVGSVHSVNLYVARVTTVQTVDLKMSRLEARVGSRVVSLVWGCLLLLVGGVLGLHHLLPWWSVLRWGRRRANNHITKLTSSLLTWGFSTSAPFKQMHFTCLPTQILPASPSSSCVYGPPPSGSVSGSPSDPETTFRAAGSDRIMKRNSPDKEF